MSKLIGKLRGLVPVAAVCRQHRPAQADPGSRIETPRPREILRGKVEPTALQRDVAAQCRGVGNIGRIGNDRARGPGQREVGRIEPVEHHRQQRARQHRPRRIGRLRQTPIEQAIRLGQIGIVARKPPARDQRSRQHLAAQPLVGSNRVSLARAHQIGFGSGAGRGIVCRTEPRA